MQQSTAKKKTKKALSTKQKDYSKEWGEKTKQNKTMSKKEQLL